MVCILARATTGWRTIEWEGKSLAFTSENCGMINSKNPWIMEQVDCRPCHFSCSPPRRGHSLGATTRLAQRDTGKGDAISLGWYCAAKREPDFLPQLDGEAVH